MQDTIIGVSSSYDNSKNPAKEAAAKYLNDIQRQSSLRTIPIYRGKINISGKEIDNLKFLYPLSKKGAPIIAKTLLNAYDQGVPVRNIGNSEIGNLVELINDEIGTDISFADEGDETSLSNSFEKLFPDLHENNYFVSGDIPFAKNYTKPGYTGDIVFDFNTSLLLSDIEHITRNFYNKAKASGKTCGFKEPNIFFFSKYGFNILQEAANIFYQNRKGGGLFDAITSYIKMKYSSDKYFRKYVKRSSYSLGTELVKVVLQKSKIPSPAINFDKCNRILSRLYNLDWQMTFQHKDIFRMLDIDGLNNDWVLYYGIATNLEKAGKLDKRLSRIRKAMESNKDMFPVTLNFEEIIKGYTRQVDEHLPEEYKINFKSVDIFVEQFSNKEAEKELTNLIIKNLIMKNC